MGAMGVMPKGSKKVKFGKFAVFQNWLWVHGRYGHYAKRLKKGGIWKNHGFRAVWALWALCQKVEKR